ncbi:DegT/DnrJ/EryC1/StrS family aminotransferase [Guggenheimella bovis]
MKITFSPPDISEEEILEVQDTLRSGWITTGPKVKRFEEELTAFTGSAETVAVASATAGLETVLRLFGIKEGDEVITPSYTYTASASSAHHVGAKIVLCDVKENTWFFDLEKLESLITEKTKAIIPVDIGGVMADYEKIYEIVERKKHLFRGDTELQKKLGRILVLSDSAHSFGAVQKGKKSGTVADFSVFSFHAVKNLTTAEGGAIQWKKELALDDEKIKKELYLLILHGQSKSALEKSLAGSWEYDIVHLGYKANMTDIFASIGLVQLKRYPELLEKRRNIVRKYNEAFKDERFQVLEHLGDDYTSSCHLYLIRLLGETSDCRNALIKKLAEKEIAANVHYKPLPLFTAYKNLGFKMEDYPESFKQYENVLTLPLHTLLTEEQTDYIIKSFLESYHDCKKDF